MNFNTAARYLRATRKAVEILTSSVPGRSKSRELLWPLFRHVYSNVECLGIKNESGAIVLAHTQDRHLTLELLTYGRYKTSNLPKALELLKKLGRPSGDYFIDVGANIGTETISALLSGQFDYALAIEPEIRNYNLLRANLIINDLADRARVYQVAISNREGTALIALSAKNRGDHRVSVSGAGSATHTVGHQIAMAPLDQMVRSAGISPSAVSLVWVDTQGYDGFVLDGAQSLIDANARFVVELWPAQMQRAGSLDVGVGLIESKFDGYYNLSNDRWDELHQASTIRDLVRNLQATERDDAAADLLLINGP